MKREYRNAARTKRMIRRALIELFEEKGRLTVEEIAARADIAKSTFYNHYDDIYALLAELENELIASLTDALDAFEKERTFEYDAYIAAVIGFLKQNEQLYRTVLGYSNERYDVRFFIEKLKRILVKRLYALPLQDRSDARYVEICFLVNGCVDTMVDYFRGILPLSIEAVDAIIREMVRRICRV